MSGSPVIKGDFSLIPVVERLEWRQALARHLLKQTCFQDGNKIPEWKFEEHVRPMSLRVDEILAEGIHDSKEFERIIGSAHAISK